MVDADGNEVGPAEQDVGGLVDGVGEHQRARGPAGRLGLGPHGRVAVEFGIADQAQERHDELVESGACAVGEDQAPVGVEAGGQVVRDEAADDLGEVPARVLVGEDLVVGDQHGHRHPEGLKPDPVGERPEVVPEVQRPGGPVPTEDPERPRV